MKIFEAPKIKIRVSPLTFVVGGFMVAEVVLAIICLSLPWGASSTGTDIRFGLAGLLPWFAFIPVLLQAGYMAVDSGVLQGFYIIMNFLIGAFIIFVQYLTLLKYSTFQTGFYLVFVLGGLVILTGFICMIEKRVHNRLVEKGKAKVIPVTFG
ncbi:MAG TPA: hypothetical protein VIJ97_03460 [Candidatus Anoxymicrobiaceae bacterium]